jgi:hypothetical protein
MKKTKELLMDMQNKEEQMAHNGLNGLTQETLKEAAERYARFNFDSSFLDIDDHFIAGAKYQAERMYTEEDLRRAYNYGMFAVTSGRSFSDWVKERNK